MLKDLVRYFDSFVGKRTEEIGEVILIHNLLHQKLVDEKKACFEELLKIIPDSSRDLLYDLEDKTNYQAAFVNELMYRQGLLDGLNFRNVALNRHVKEDFTGDFKEGTDIKQYCIGDSPCGSYSE